MTDFVLHPKIKATTWFGKKGLKENEVYIGCGVVASFEYDHQVVLKGDEGRGVRIDIESIQILVGALEEFRNRKVEPS